jgi:pimeloyl-ACP methyl ester carboxylesterase
MPAPAWGLLLALPFAVGCAAADSGATFRLTSFREELCETGALHDLVVDGRQYCYLDQGQGSPLVLLHGLGGSLYDWRHLIGPLSQNHRVIAIDLLGAGESELPEGEDYSVAAQARRVRGLLDHLGVERATLVGSSYGGGIALRFAQDWPERVLRLVLMNSICYAEKIPASIALAKLPFAACIAEAVPLGKATRWVLGDTDRTIEILSEEELSTYTQEFERLGRRRTMIETLRMLIPPDTAEFEARLRKISAPALLIWGVLDKSVPLDLGRRLARDLPKATLFEVEAGHVPNQERPDEVLRLMRSFLSKEAGPIDD